MNYVPGTASLIDDIDSKLGTMIYRFLLNGEGLMNSTSKKWYRVCATFLTVYYCRLSLMCWLCAAEKHLVLLRDGRTLIGYLRSIDQFGITHSLF